MVRVSPLKTNPQGIIMLASSSLAQHWIVQPSLASRSQTSRAQLNLPYSSITQPNIAQSSLAKSSLVAQPSIAQHRIAQSSIAQRPLAFCLSPELRCSTIKLKWKGLTLTNTSAYYKSKIITAIKSLIVPAPGVIMLFGSSDVTVTYQLTSFIGLKYQTWVEVTNIDKHFSSLQTKNNHGYKMFNSTGPWCNYVVWFKSIIRD